MTYWQEVKSGGCGVFHVVIAWLMLSYILCTQMLPYLLQENPRERKARVIGIGLVFLR